MKNKKFFYRQFLRAVLAPLRLRVIVFDLLEHGAKLGGTWTARAVQSTSLPPYSAHRHTHTQAPQMSSSRLTGPSDNIKQKSLKQFYFFSLQETKCSVVGILLAADTLNTDYSWMRVHKEDGCLLCWTFACSSTIQCAYVLLFRSSIGQRQVPRGSARRGNPNHKPVLCSSYPASHSDSSVIFI
jgi:hypothetical protein